ncbi:MAG TPA: DinB family protein [Acidimicrobiales bacterium]|nr:DinB family protein [Acidimicrobiales bacterium]
MPFLAPAINDEKGALLSFLNQQRDAVRASVGGLTDEQASTSPSVSQLSLAGLLKHVIRCEWGWMVETVARSDEAPPFALDGNYEDGFRMTNGETVADLLRQYDVVAARTEEIVAGIEDLGTTFPAPKFEWFPTEGLEWSPRWVLLHLIEEVGRHAGHADIIRETLDGTQAFALIDALDASRVGAAA